MRKRKRQVHVVRPDGSCFPEPGSMGLCLSSEARNTGEGRYIVCQDVRTKAAHTIIGPR